MCDRCSAQDRTGKSASNTEIYGRAAEWRGSPTTSAINFLWIAKLWNKNGLKSIRMACSLKSCFQPDDDWHEQIYSINGVRMCVKNAGRECSSRKSISLTKTELVSRLSLPIGSVPMANHVYRVIFICVFNLTRFNLVWVADSYLLLTLLKSF